LPAGIRGRLVAIVGPTGVGKSRLGLWLARDFGGEIVSADSRQVYRYMDIGTAKPSPDEQSLVAHHLIDVVDPDQDFSLACYQEMAYQAIDGIVFGGRLPILAGGSGQYVWAVLEGWQVPRVPPDGGFRRHLQERATQAGGHSLYQELKAMDPAAAGRIDPRNVRRVIRALEVARGASAPVSETQGKQAPPYQLLIIGLTAERAELYRRTDARVDAMIQRGLVDEVRELVRMGYGETGPVASGIGYRQVLAFLRDEISLEEAVRQIKTETHRLVRQQYAWFRRQDGRIEWFDIQAEPEEGIRALVGRFLKAA